VLWDSLWALASNNDHLQMGRDTIFVAARSALSVPAKGASSRLHWHLLHERRAFLSRPGS